MDWMSHALTLAQKGAFTCAPNPMVGCVIVKNNELISEGWHCKAGEDHAEVIALKNAGSRAFGSDVYITFEPCCHYGRTPPCVNALIAAGVKRVFIAVLDPNPLVHGQGINRLQEAGIYVEVGQHQEEATRLNEIFFWYMNKKRPFVIAKWAMSLDGKMAAKSAQSQWITEEKARLHAHGLRHQVQAIMVGAQTVKEDNPKLTVRGISPVLNQPKRIIITSQGDISPESHVFNGEVETIVFTTDRVNSKWESAIQEKGISCYQLPQNHGRIDLEVLLEEIAALGISSLLVEGGSHLLTQFIEQDLVNRFYAYIAPKLIGGVSSKTPFEGTGIECMSAVKYLIRTSMIDLDPDVCLIFNAINNRN